MEKTPEKQILDILKNTEVSLTVSRIAELTNMHRVTASKYLAVMEAKGVVKHREVGKAKLHQIVIEGKK